MLRVTFDCESTGVDPAEDRVTQIGLLDHATGERYVRLVNPGRPIPAEVQALTGITDADVKDVPRFEAIAAFVANLLRGKTLIGFGCNRFDVPLLAAEFERAGVDFEFGPVIDAGEMFKIFHGRTLTDAVQLYLQRKHTGAHEAMADVLATRDVFEKQLVIHADVLAGKTDAELAVFSNHGKKVADPAGKLAFNDAGELVFNTFRNRGVRVLDDVGYATWMADRMPAATCRLINRELARSFPEAAGLFDADDSEGGVF